MSPLRDVFRRPEARGEVPADELRDPRLIFHMLDTLYLERSGRDDRSWNPGEQQLEQMTVERLVAERQTAATRYG